ncbi:unnamed protein product, partial [Ceratitis capitata]
MCGCVDVSLPHQTACNTLNEINYTETNAKKSNETATRPHGDYLSWAPARERASVRVAELVKWPIPGRHQHPER